MSQNNVFGTMEIKSMDQQAEANSSSPDKSKDAAASKVRRRNRMITSCLECRRRKLKCDKQQPCTNCSKFSRDCMFLAPALDSVSQKKLNEIKEKMGSLERTLEDDVARRKSQDKRDKHQRLSADLPGEGSDSDNEPIPEDEKGLEATPLATVDAGYEYDGDDDVMDLGFRVGKFRMTERLGGLFRPKLAEEMVFALVRDNKRGTEPEAPLRDDPNTCLEPGQVFIPPGSGFVFGDSGTRRNIVDFLPTKQVSDVLIKRYQTRVHLLCRVVHWPTFQVQYENFWTSILSGIEPSAALQAVVFAVSFAAVASMSEEDVSSVCQQPYRQALTNFQTATEVALAKGQFLRTTRFEALQALIIYLIPMCRGEISRAHSVLVGAAIRLGECFGLHRDPVETFGHQPIDAHLRRLAWFQLCYLDFKTAEAQGPRPAIKRDDYDTKLPWNLDDNDLLLIPNMNNQSVVLQDRDGQWTDMTLTRIRFECNEMHRIVWNDRNRLDKKKVSITHCLAKVESFRTAMEEKYVWLDMAVPIQHYAKLLLDMLLLRMHIMILHKFHNATSTRIPDRLRQLIIVSGTELSESGVILDTDPKFENFRWYISAVQTWHTAFLLLVEVFVFPNRRQADRIWKIADHVFEPDLSLTRVQKARSILAAVRDRAAQYRNLRKIKEPVSMRNRLNTNLPTRGRIRGPEMVVSGGDWNGSNMSESQKIYSKVAQDENTPFNAALGTSNGLHASNYNAPNVNMASDSEQQTGSWSVDAPFTLFFGISGSKPSPNTQSNSSLLNSTSSPPQIGARHPGEPTPSESSHLSGSEQWPVVAGNDTYQFQGSAAQPPYNHISPSDQSLSPPPLYGNSAMGLMSGQFIPENALTPQSYAYDGSVSSGMSPDPMGGMAGSQSVVHPNVAIGMQSLNNCWGPAQFQQQKKVLQQLPIEMPVNAADVPMLDIDWSEWDKLFPLEMNNGVLDLPPTQIVQ